MAQRPGLGFMSTRPSKARVADFVIALIVSIAIRQENWEGRRWAYVKFENTAARPIATDCMLLTYLVTVGWNYETAPSRAICSTIYVGSSGRRKVVLHQQTAL